MNNNYKIYIGMKFVQDGVRYKIYRINNGIVTCTSVNFGTSYITIEGLITNLNYGHALAVFGSKGGDLIEWIER